MASKVEQAKKYFDEVHQKIIDLGIEVPEWHLDVGGTEAGTTIAVSLKLLVPKQKK
jgi:hypothetical protein